MKKICNALLLTGFIALGISGPAAAQEEEKRPDIIVDKSRIVIEEVLLSEDKKVPTDFIRDCTGLAIIPGMIKGGLIIGGSYGKGVVLSHKGGAWSPPAFISLTAGSLGFQIGAQSIDLILVVFGEDTMNAFLKSKFKLGGDVALVAGPVGVQATAATEITLKGGIYSYSRSKGLFAGVSLEGAVVSNQYDLNKSYYNAPVNTDEIFAGKVTLPPNGNELIAALEKVKYP